MYPHISRTLLAREVGLHVSTIAGILKGRTAPSLETAVTMAKAIGVKVERLNEDLKAQRDSFKSARTPTLSLTESKPKSKSKSSK